MAEKVATKYECNIYEWETVKTWDDFKQLMSDIFTGELYDSTIDHYNFSINMPERGSVMHVDGKIGYSVADDHTVPDPEIYDNSDIEVLSEDGDRITFRCAGTQHIGNISTGIDEHLYIRFDAVRTDDVLKIERVEYESDIGADRYSVTAIITDKLDELGKEVTEYIADSERGIVLAAVSALGNDTGYDIYRFSENTEEHLFTVPRNNLTRIARYTENGADFLIIYMAGAVGRGYPATVITIRDGEPVILSEYDPDDAEYTDLFYYPAYDLIGDRGVGISAGANSFIPYHWDGESLVPYRLHEIRPEYLHKLDKDRIVPDIYKAVYFCLEGEYEFDLSYLDGLSSLTEVELGSCNITGHTHLENVQAVDTTLSYISADELVTSFPNVKYLQVDHIDSVAPLAGLESLEYLRVYLGTPINDIAAVKGCKSLKILHMSTDKIAPDDSFLLRMDGLMRLCYCYGTFTEETVEKLHKKYPYIEIDAFEPAL